MVNMLKTFVIFSSSVLIASCSCLHHLPPAENNTNVRDSIVINYRDCVRVIPVEKIVDIVPQYDTLKLETSLSTAEAFVDTATHTLKGKIENKKGAEFKYIEKVEYREHHDTTYVKEPFEIVKEKKVTPRWAYWTLTFSLAVFAYIGIRIYLKLKTGGLVK